MKKLNFPVINRKGAFEMNILLIYPKFPDTFWSFTYALSFIGKKAAFPPLGLLTVASLLPEEWPKRLVDVNVDNLTDKDLLWADMAFIGGMAVQRKSAEQIIARCNASNLKVIAGGPLFTSEPDEFMEVDHLVLDEAELTLPAFLSDLENGQPAKGLQGFRFLRSLRHPDSFVESVKNETICLHEHSVFQGMPFQLRILQCDGSVRSPVPCKNTTTSYRGAGPYLCFGLAKQYIFC
jgi:radical SAM superfamily enzyme YgiQ (UPF0313 family)